MKISKEELFGVCGNPRPLLDFGKNNKENWNSFLICVGRFAKERKKGITFDAMREELLDKGLLTEAQADIWENRDVFFRYMMKDMLEKEKERRELFDNINREIESDMGEIPSIDYDELYRLGEEIFIKRYGKYRIEEKEDTEIKKFKVSKLVPEKEFSEEGEIEI